MKKKFLTFLVVLFLMLSALPATASAELMDKDADPVPVVSGGSFEATSGTKMDFGVSGGTLTGAKWTIQRHYASYGLTGTFKKGETVSLSVTGTETPLIAESSTRHLVWNGLGGYIDYYTGNGSRIGETQSYQSEYVQSSPLSHEFTATIPDEAKEMVIRANFVCRWTVDYSLEIVEEFVAIDLKLKVEEEEEPAAVLPVEPEPSPDSGLQPLPAPKFSPDSAPYSTLEQEDRDGKDPWTHAGPLATIFIAIAAALAAIFGGGIGTAAGVAGGAPGGDAGFAKEPPSMVIITTNGAQILVVQDPVTGEWINSETGNPIDISRHEEFTRQQQETLAQQRARNAELENAGQTDRDHGGQGHCPRSQGSHHR